MTINSIFCLYFKHCKWVCMDMIPNNNYFTTQLSSITESNYLLAKFYWLTHSAALLLPTIIQENCTEFAMFIINIFAHCDEVSEIEPRRYDIFCILQNIYSFSRL